MTTDPRAAAEKWLHEQFYSHCKDYLTIEDGETYARIAADFAERYGHAFATELYGNADSWETCKERAWTAAMQEEKP